MVCPVSAEKERHQGPMIGEGNCQRSIPQAKVSPSLEQPNPQSLFHLSAAYVLMILHVVVSTKIKIPESAKHRTGSELLNLTFLTG